MRAIMYWSKEQRLQIRGTALQPALKSFNTVESDGTGITMPTGSNADA